MGMKLVSSIYDNDTTDTMLFFAWDKKQSDVTEI